MGNKLFDKYSLLHITSGIIAFYLGLTIQQWAIFHMLFEVIENLEYGRYIINNYITMWPGGKPKADNYINVFGDNISAVLGWIIGYKMSTTI